MIAMSGMLVHSACHPGGGMFVRPLRLLMQMLVGVSVVHVALVFHHRDFERLYHCPLRVEVRHLGTSWLPRC